MIVDLHAHAFPRFGQSLDPESVELQMQQLQHHILFHPQGFRRKKDAGYATEQLLFDGVHDGISGLSNIDLRPGRWGRLEWSHDGEDYYIQWMPPMMSWIEAPPEMLIAFMDYVGVDKAVLQSDHVYGDLNVCLAECVRKYPRRLIGLAQVKEWETHQRREQDRLRQAIEELGMKGLYYFVEGFNMTDFKDNFADEKYSGFWKQFLFACWFCR